MYICAQILQKAPAAMAWGEETIIHIDCWAVQAFFVQMINWDFAENLQSFNQIRQSRLA